MRRQQWGLYAIALAILIVGLIWAGFPASTVLIAGLVMICPLMMLFMHGGGHKHGSSVQHHTTHDTETDERESATRR